MSAINALLGLAIVLFIGGATIAGTSLAAKQCPWATAGAIAMLLAIFVGVVAHAVQL